MSTEMTPPPPGRDKGELSIHLLPDGRVGLAVDDQCLALTPAEARDFAEEVLRIAALVDGRRCHVRYIVPHTPAAGTHHQEHR